MGEWKETTLSDICLDISYGYTESADENEVGPKFLRITDIANGRLDWESVPYCPISESDFEKYRLYPGDIVIARTGATTGANYTVQEHDPNDLVYASYLIRYKINPKQAYPFYIGYILKSSQWNEYVAAIAGGSAQPGANAKQLGSFEILLPTLSEQKAIASVLSSLDDKIDLLHRQNQTLEAIAETLFRQWFVEEAEEDWDEGELGDLIHLEYGKGLKKSDRSGRGYPVIGSSGIIDYHEEYLVEAPGIVIGRKGTLGETIYLTKNFHPIDTTYYVTSKVRSKGFYFEYFLLKGIGFEKMNSDSAVPGLNRNMALAIELRIPPIKLINKFSEKVDPFFKKVEANKSQINILESLRDTLLPKFMSGYAKIDLQN